MLFLYLSKNESFALYSLLGFNLKENIENANNKLRNLIYKPVNLLGHAL